MDKEQEGSINNALDDVLLSMEQWSHLFESRIQTLRTRGHNERELAELVKGVLAMKDSAGIYAAWGRHYIERLNQAEKTVSHDDVFEEE